MVEKAVEDEEVLAAHVNDESIADAVLGFHAQQAVEKLFKAALSARDAEYPWTHDLRHLMDLLDQVGQPVPTELAAVKRLTPWAAQFRYGATIDEELDRAETLRLVQATKAWVAELIDRAQAQETERPAAGDSQPESEVP